MDWSNEEYVRVYKRDTTNWRRMGWDGQNVCLQLLRKVDRAGALELAGLEPWEAVMLAINGPEDAVQRGVSRLLELGTLKVLGDLLVFPNHIAAQEAVKSDRLRQKESRERRALGGGAHRVTETAQPVTSTHAPSQAVTNRDGAVPERDTESQAVTGGHGESRPVTNGHSLLCSALPTSAVHTNAPVVLHEGESSDKPQLTPPPPVSASADFEVREAFRAAYDLGEMPALYGQKLRAAVDHCRALAKRYEQPLAEVAARVCKAAGPGTKSWDFDVAKVDPYVTAPERSGRTRGFTPPAPAEGFTGQEADLDDLFGRLKPKGVANAR